MNNEPNVLPADFDGVFRFTNFTENDFSAKWNNVEYTFPALKTTPMIIGGATPEEVQNIRKKFARELAILCFYGTAKFEGMNSPDKGRNPALYTDGDLASFIQRCLEPLPAAQIKSRKLPSDDENKYSKDEEGKPITRVLKKNESLLSGTGNVVA